MAVNSFIPSVWSARLLQNLQKALVFGRLVNRDYEGEIRAAGDTVKIGGIGAITVSGYTRNSTTINWQVLADASQSLVIDQYKYIAFKVDDVDKVQTNVALVDEAMREAAYGLADTLDQFVAGMYTGAASGNKVGADGASAKVIGYGGSDVDPYKQLVDMGVVLSEANIPTEGRWAVVPPWYEGMLRKSASFGANPAGSSTEAALINGYLGRIAGFDVYTSNNVTNDGQATPTYRCLFGVRQAISLAVQKEPTLEALRLQDVFGDGVRGLTFYGGTVVRPVALAVLFAKKGT